LDWLLLISKEAEKAVIYGQDKVIKLARAGLREPEKPIGCYLFSGPTGVGKLDRPLARRG
jgi:hypothetical protein